MPRLDTDRRERILLEILAGVDCGLSPREFDRNFNCDREQTNACFERLVDKGLVEHLGDDVYQLSEDGRNEVLLPVRGAAATTVDD